MTKKRNRIKCKLCGDTVESMHDSDLQICSCGEISVDGGTSSYKATCKDPKNLLLIDEDGKEETPTFIEEKEEPVEEGKDLPPLTKEDLLEMLKLHLEGYDNLPDHAKYKGVTVHDLQSLALLLYSILKRL
jgi:hypothetical protein